MVRSRRTRIALEDKLRVENEQLKLTLAEAMVQLRIWQRGAALAPRVPGPAPKVDPIEALAAEYAEALPAWGYRKIATLARRRSPGHQFLGGPRATSPRIASAPTVSG